MASFADIYTDDLAFAVEKHDGFVLEYLNIVDAPAEESGDDVVEAEKGFRRLRRTDPPQKRFLIVLGYGFHLHFRYTTLFVTVCPSPGR